MIEKLPNPGAVKVFNRYISDAEVPVFFSAADVCVLPYKTATQSGITAMAYHFDVPVIVTPAGGLAQAVEGPGTGLVTNRTEVQALTQTIRKFYSMDRDFFVKNIGQIKEVLSWDSFARDLITFVNNH